MNGAPSGRRPLRVIKVGGSLLDWAPLSAALVRWFDAQAAASNVLIAGGGEFADVIRRADATYGLGDELSHELCVDVLGVTARLLAAVLAEKASLATWADVGQRRAAGRLPDCVVLDARDFLRGGESAASSLPHTWDVTTDSTAAAVACALAADELVLLKSCDPPGKPRQELSSHALAEAGYVDRHFPTAIGPFGGRVQMVNLRQCGGGTSKASLRVMIPSRGA